MNNIQICKFCSKCFKRKTYFEKHVMMCERLSEGKKQVFDKEIEDTLKENDYKILIMNLISTQETLKKQINQLLNKEKSTLKKIDAITWLNDNIKPEKDLIKLLTDFNLTKDELQFIFDNNLQDGLINIFNNLFNNDISPFQCLDIKKDFLIFQNKKWEICDKDYFKTIINIVHKKILDSFYEWKRDNKEKLSSQEFNKLLDINSQKVLYNDMETLIVKIKPKIYGLLKKNFNNLIRFT